MARKRLLRDADFLAELSAYAQAQRTLIEAECSGFATDATARDIRRTRAQGDFRFFCRTYFPHYVRGEESVFHAWFYDDVPGLLDDAAGHLIDFSAPRGEAKSTLCTQLCTLWCVVTGRKHFVPIVMDSFDQAVTMLEAIKTELTDNPRLQMDWPDACGQGRVWNAGVALTANNRKLQAFGSGKKMRGLRHGPHRPDLVILDDIENDENVRSKTQRDKLESWVLKTVLNLGPPEGTMDVLYPNTVLHYDSVANRFHRKPRWVRRRFKAILRWPDRMDLWDEWERLLLEEQAQESAEPIADGADPEPGAADAFYRQHRAEMEQGAVVSWPSVRPLLKLMMIRAESHKAFDCEFQNDPTNDENAPFAGMKYWVVPCSDWIFLGVLDPALGRSATKGDYAAALVGGWERNRSRLSIVEAAVARMRPELQLQRLINWQREYRCLLWGIEDTGFQEYFRQEIVRQSAEAKVPIPAIGIRNESPNGGRGENIKDLLIESIAPHVANGLILFHQRHVLFNEQVRHWPEADHDDAPDALQMLWRLCLTRGRKTSGIIVGKRRQPILKV